MEEKYQALRELENYKRKKQSQATKLLLEIEKLKQELAIVRNKMVRFAQNSRDITAKAYGIGQSTYFELLKSELQLQSILLKDSKLEAKLYQLKLEYKLLVGESFNV